MVKVTKNGVLLKPTELEFENDGVLNPAIVQDGDITHVFYRAVRKGNFSTIGYCCLGAASEVIQRNTRPFLVPEFDYESHGLEDPRIVKIDDLYYLSYVAFDGKNALGALATSTDLVHFEKKGIIVPKVTYNDFDRLTSGMEELNKRYLGYNPGADILADKDFVFFPRRISGKLFFLHRIKPDIQITSVNSLDELTDAFWQDYFLHFDRHIFLAPKYPHEMAYLGAGCPPIETEYGWLIIYHGVKEIGKGFEYSACAALMDIDDPRKEIGRLSYPLIKPELPYEVEGDVDNVCFPTGSALHGDKLFIYYGAADEIIACASVSLKELIAALNRD